MAESLGDIARHMRQENEEPRLSFWFCWSLVLVSNEENSFLSGKLAEPHADSELYLDLRNVAFFLFLEVLFGRLESISVIVLHKNQL